MWSRVACRINAPTLAIVHLGLLLPHLPILYLPPPLLSHMKQLAWGGNLHGCRQPCHVSLPSNAWPHVQPKFISTRHRFMKHISKKRKENESIQHFQGKRSIKRSLSVIKNKKIQERKWKWKFLYSNFKSTLTPIYFGQWCHKSEATILQARFQHWEESKKEIIVTIFFWVRS